MSMLEDLRARAVLRDAAAGWFFLHGDGRRAGNHLGPRRRLYESARVRLTDIPRSSYRARWIRSTQLTDVPPSSVEIGAAVRSRGASDADAR